MKKQIWLRVKTEQDEEMLKQIFEGFEFHFGTKKEFPVVVDLNEKKVWRVESASVCGAYLNLGGKIKESVKSLNFGF